MKKIIIMLGLAGMVHSGAVAQNDNNNANNTSNSSLNTMPAAPICGYINPNYDHSPTYYQSDCNVTDRTPPIDNQLPPIDNAPINNMNNNNTMSPFNNTISPYDNTSPYYTPPHTDAPLNNTPPEK